MSDEHSLKEDLKKSVLYHVVVVICVVVYFIFGELAAVSMQSRQPERKELASIGVEFVKAQAKPSIHKAMKDRGTRRGSDIKSQTNQVEKKDPIERQKSIEKVDRKVISEVKRLVETGVKKSELQAKSMDVLKAKTDEKKIQNQKKNEVKRQVSKIAKETKTATSKVIDLKKAVGQKRKVSAAGIHKTTLEKSKNTKKSGGVLKKSNAQVLAAKEVESTGARIVKTGEVKKTVKKLTSKDIEVEKKKQQALAREKERQAKYAKQELEEKQRKLALEEKQRKLALEEKQRKLALAEKQRKQDLAEKQRQIRASYEADQIMKYGQMIVAQIQEVALFTEGMGQLSASLKIKLDTKGVVQGVSLTKTSGNASFDRLAVNAVYKASPLPLPEDEKISQKMASINLKISPNSLE
ncbi:MAG: cell envelope integrity protein TolA [Pseudomonadota bacterium]|nr:cell envelope integrity protein TolA [Pseudomonadota bacterium]